MPFGIVPRKGKWVGKHRGSNGERVQFISSHCMRVALLKSQNMRRALGTSLWICRDRVPGTGLLKRLLNEKGGQAFELGLGGPGGRFEQA